MKKSLDQFRLFLQEKPFVRVDSYPAGDLCLFFASEIGSPPMTIDQGMVTHHVVAYTTLDWLCDDIIDFDCRLKMSETVMEWCGIKPTDQPDASFLKGKEEALYEFIQQLESMYTLF